MALEDLTGPNKFIANLVPANPPATDPASQGSDHIQGIKNVLQNSFPGMAGAYNFTKTPLTPAPAFIAGTVGGQTFTSAIASKFNNTAEVVDTANCYDAPNSRFTPNVAGYYQVNFGASIAAGTALAVLGVQVRKNGIDTPVELTAYQILPTATSSAILTLSGLVYLNGTTDYIESWILPTGTGALTAGSRPNSFSACLVKAA